MSQDPALVAAEIERRNKELTNKISELLSKQDDAQSEILKLQRKTQRSGAEDKRLDELKSNRRELGAMVGVLAAARTDLLDEIPAITTAAGELDVIAEDLAKDAALIEEAAERIKKVTETISMAENLIVKTVSLLKPLLL